MKILGFVLFAFIASFLLFTNGTSAQAVENRVTGISCLTYVGDKLLAFTGSSQNTPFIYEIRLGGLGWQHTKDAADYPGISCPLKSLKEHLIVAGAAQYRVISNKSIEISVDGGRSWDKEIDLSSINTNPRMLLQTRDVNNYFLNLARQKAQADMASIRAELYFNEKIDIRSVPLDAIVDKEIGNVIFAMGIQGLLVRTVDGNYQWSGVDVYKFQDISRKQALGILKFEMWTMFILGFLLLATIFQLITFFHPMKIGILGVSWLLWFWTVLALLQLRSPPYEYGSTSGGIFYSMVAFLFSIFSILAIAGKALDDLPIKFKQILGLAILGASFYLVPRILWTQGIIPSYKQAFWISLVLIGLFIALSWYFLRKLAKLPVWFTNKKSQPVA